MFAVVSSLGQSAARTAKEERRTDTIRCLRNTSLAFDSNIAVAGALLSLLLPVVLTDRGARD